MFSMGSLFLILLTALVHLAASDFSNGWGSDIAWKSLDDGLKAASESQKPLMLLIHKSWCGACKALKPKFAESEEIRELSSEFVMVNVQDDQEPEGEQYGPDGKYIPRLLFLDSNGKVRNEYFNEEGSASYKYYYPAVNQIVTAMQNAKGMQPLPEETRQDEL